MNREIKFRVWDTEYKEMLYDPEYMLSAKGRLYINYKIGAIKYFGEGGVVQQYTGLKDKNGKEIYEGDIIRQSSRNRLVEWNEQFCGFSPFVDWDEYQRSGPNFEPHRCRILGNVFENPELLK